MDKIIDHLFVFDGKGMITDFPGNYTQYRNSLEESSASAPVTKKPEVTANERPIRKTDINKLTFKEKRELEMLEDEISTLEARKRELEEKLQSGSLGHESLFATSQEIGRLGDQLMEKELRWLELSDKE
jgi:ATP-binding cassette subfamily F protein uup